MKKLLICLMILLSTASFAFAIEKDPVIGFYFKNHTLSSLYGYSSYTSFLTEVTLPLSKISDTIFNLETSNSGGMTATTFGVGFRIAFSHDEE